MTRRDQPGRKEQPAQKKRRIDKEEYIRVIQTEEKGEKRGAEKAEGEEEVEKGIAIYPIFKRRKKLKVKEEGKEENSAKEIEVEEPTNLTTEEEVKKRELELEEEDLRRKERKERATKLSKRWELLRLCKEIMKSDGINWNKSKERRELEFREEMERQRREKLDREAKENENHENEKRKVQTKITECWARLPEVRRKNVEAAEDRERRLLLKEAKEELWKRWRQKKGRKIKKPGELRDNERRNMEKRLERIEEELIKEKEEREKEQEVKEKIKNEKIERQKRKEKKEKHWEMLRWTVAFLEENKSKWEEIRRRREEDIKEDQEYENWKEMKLDEKMTQLEARKIKSTREERIEKAKIRTEAWQRWRERQEEEQKTEEDEKQLSLSQPANQADSLSEFIPVRAPPGLPLLGPSPSPSVV